jgi:hypothetical protein
MMCVEKSGESISNDLWMVCDRECIPKFDSTHERGEIRDGDQVVAPLPRRKRVFGENRQITECRLMAASEVVYSLKLPIFGTRGDISPIT